MRDKFTVTISDTNGSKHYLLHQVIKKIAFYFAFFVFTIIATGMFVISFLMDNVEKLEKKKRTIIIEQNALKKDYNKLQRQIKEKTEEFIAIKDKITDIEELVGISPIIEEKVDIRLSKIKLTSNQQKIFFSYIPNGNVIQNKGYTAAFGWRHHPLLKRREFHRGIDMRASMRTPVRAPADGVVESAGFSRGGYGNLVIVQHGYGFKTVYGHLVSRIPVKVGDFVKKGTIIAYTGNSGLSTGPHLHYEVKFLNRPLDPRNFIEWNSSNFTEIFKKETRVSWQSLIQIIKHQLHLQKQL